MVKQQNPYEPISQFPKSLDGSITRIVLLAVGLLALSAACVVFMLQVYLVLPLVFAVALSWTAGYRFVTCAVSALLAYLLAFIGIEIALELTELGPAMADSTSGLYSRMLVAAGIVSAFMGVLLTLTTRTLINWLLIRHMGSRNKLLPKLLRV
ncbi:MAG: hypothetical protein NXI32_03340 [bacterium]|nr:hypothetical protein [bacterium]